MIKQIKKRLIIVAVLGMVNITSVSYAAIPSPSDVVENTSVIDEQSNTSLDEDVIVVEPIPVVNEVPKENKPIFYGWTTAKVNVRTEPNLLSAIIQTVNYNTQIIYREYNADWVEIEYEGTTAFMAKQYISDTKNEFRKVNVPDHPDFKSYMGYTSITDITSKQYQLQTNYAYTGDYGIRQVEGRYCVALGSYFEVAIGQCFDLVLENGTVIPCIMADLKDDRHTNIQNIFTEANGCCSEFIIDPSALILRIKKAGNVSYACSEWNSKVVTINIYDRNILI